MGYDNCSGNRGLDPDAFNLAIQRIAEMPSHLVRRLRLATHATHHRLVEAGVLSAEHESATDRAARTYRRYGIDGERASRLAVQEVAAHTTDDSGSSQSRLICVWEPTIGIAQGAEFTGEELVFPDGQRFLVARPVEGEALAETIQRGMRGIKGVQP